MFTCVEKRPLTRTGCTLGVVLMLSSGLQWPSHCTRLVRDGSSIIYLAEIHGEIRDVLYVGRRTEDSQEEKERRK